MDTTSPTAMLVGMRDMFAAHPNAVSTTISRGEIEEALSSELPVELILEVQRPPSPGMGAETRTVTVAWDRADLESLLGDTEADAMTFSFDRHELERALDEPEFEGHGLRETAMIITVAAAAAMGASAASAMPIQDPGQSAENVTAVSIATHRDGATVHDEATLAARGIDTVAATATLHDGATLHDEATLAARGIDTVAATATLHDGATLHDEATLAARGIDTVAATATLHDGATLHDEATLAARGTATPAPTGDSGAGFALPSLDSAAVVGVGAGLGGAALLIATAMFTARRNRIRSL